jgi:hypothetical protein
MDVSLALVVLPVVLAGDPPPRTVAVHAHSRENPKVVVDKTGNRVRVDRPEGTVWLRQVTDCGPDPYPGCLECHCDIENSTINMAGMELDCTFCHGGDPLAITKEAAHVASNGQVTYNQTVPPIDQDLDYQRFVNPSNLRSLDQTCGFCHLWEAIEIRESMMATAAGHYAGGLYQNNVVDTKTPVYGTFAVADTDGTVPTEKGAVESLLDLLIYSGGDPQQVATHFAAVPSQGCARCHLWSRGKGYQGAVGADGTYRADGCAACHVVYANDGLSQTADASIDHEEPGHPINHVITKQVPTEQCVHCHHRGARIGLSFTGRAQMPPRLPSGPGVPGTTDVVFNGNYHYTVADTNPPDAHGAAGLQCIDCHTRLEVMGDGNIYGHMDQATKIECRTCHGLPGELPTMLDNDGQPLPNVQDNGEDIVLTSKVTGAQHVVPIAMDVVSTNPNAACAMNDTHLKADGGLECYSCHSAWIPNCYGCHFERDEQQMGLNLMTGELEVGKVRTSNKIFETMRPFALGPNSEGRVAPYIVGCQPIADVTAANGDKILDFVMPVTTNGLSGLALNPVNPHTVRGAGEVRSCAECHRAPPSLGLGGGAYAIARVHAYTAGVSGVRLYDRDADPGQPVPDGAIPVVGTAHAIASQPNVVEGTADFVYVAQGVNGVAIHDRRPDAPLAPIASVGGIDAIDVSRAARYLYVVDAGVGVRIYDNDDPYVATLVATVPIPTAVRAVPWGIHLFVAAGAEGLVVVDIAEHTAPIVVGSVPGIDAVDVQLYAHYQAGPDFAVRAYVADPGYGVRIVDLLPDHAAPQLVGGLPLVGAVGLDAYTRWAPGFGGAPSREFDYLYIAAGAAGLHVYDMTDPDSVYGVAAMTNLGGSVADVDVASQLAPPGVDDYAVVANETLGLQVVDVTDPLDPVMLGTVPDSPGATRVLIEVQQMDRFIDEQGNPLKENSHPFTGVFTRADIVRILSASIDCETAPCPSDINGDGTVDVVDFLALLGAWGDCPPAGECPSDINGNGTVDVIDFLALLAEWGPCP